jgi:hypothetical protein
VVIYLDVFKIIALVSYVTLVIDFTKGVITMKELYYPEINIKEDNWLKYALLSKKELYTIKPMQYSNLNYKNLNNRINQAFLKPYNPTNMINLNDSNGASFEKTIINHMTVISTNRDQFKMPDSSDTYIDEKLRAEEKNAFLFEGKFTPEIENFVLELGYGERFQDYIKVSERFAIIYMGILAEHISYLDNSVSIVSKPLKFKQYLDNLSILSNGPLALRYCEHNDSKELYKEQVVSLVLPKNINELSIEKLFERNIDITDKEDVFKEIFEVRDAIDSILKSKLGRTVITSGVGFVLSLYSPPFIMSEALNLVVSASLQSHVAKLRPIRLREGISAMRVITNLHSL